jgi:predicted phage terminase large subunit-like protein
MPTIKPQPGPQERFLATSADIAVFGGAAGGGKSFAALLEPLRHIGNPEFGAVIFRRNLTEVTEQGGLWDEASKLYAQLGATPNRATLQWRFPSGAKVGFAHLDREDTVYKWQGAQIPLIEFDELTHFTAKQFWYMLSRNRSTCGVRPYIRGTCNPDPDSFVAKLVEWWIDDETGLAIPERSGVVRYFVRSGDDLSWGASKAELVERFPGTDPDTDIKSFTFVASSVYDNRILLAKDPQYLGNLKALCRVDRERLLHGNWKIRPTSGMYFRREYFEVVDAAPSAVSRVRAWDLAATTPTAENPDPDWTVGIRVSRDASGVLYVEDLVHMRGSSLAVEQAMRNTASQDGMGTRIGVPQDPGQAGKSQYGHLARVLSGYTVEKRTPSKDKETRAKPASAQAEAGNIKVVRGKWNDVFFSDLINFPDANHDDIADGLSDAVDMLANTHRVSVRPFPI